MAEQSEDKSTPWVRLPNAPLADYETRLNAKGNRETRPKPAAQPEAALAQVAAKPCPDCGKPVEDDEDEDAHMLCLDRDAVLERENRAKQPTSSSAPQNKWEIFNEAGTMIPPLPELVDEITAKYPPPDVSIAPQIPAPGWLQRTAERIRAEVNELPMTAWILDADLKTLVPAPPTTPKREAALLASLGDGDTHCVATDRAVVFALRDQGKITVPGECYDGGTIVRKTIR